MWAFGLIEPDGGIQAPATTPLQAYSRESGCLREIADRERGIVWRAKRVRGGVCRAVAQVYRRVLE